MPHIETYVDGVWFPSVSTIIGAKPSPWLDAWKEKWGHLATRKMEIANKIGTEFHRCIEEYVHTGSFSINSSLNQNMRRRICSMMLSFTDWANNVDGDIHDTELKVISRQYKYSGTLDAVGTFNGKPMLYDWKTSAKIYPDMNLQLVAYAQAYKELTGIELKQGMIVHVSKDKPHFKLTTKTFKLGKRPLKKFLKLREVFDDAMLIPTSSWFDTSQTGAENND